MKVLFFHRNAEWLGIEYLSSALKKAGHETELIFDPGAGDVEYKFKILDNLFDLTEKMVKKAREYNPDLIAFSCLTNLYPWVSKMAERLKRDMQVPIIVGGLHPTILPDFVIQNPHIDIICVGEGEEPLTELLNSMREGEMDYTIKNLWFKKDGQIIKNSPRTLIQGLDALPFPDKDLFKKYGCFSGRLYVMTGRGCPNQCTYCFNSYYRKLLCSNNARYVRRRSVENVIKELIFFKSKYKLKEIFFYDDIFTINDVWVREFCLAYKKNIRLPFKILVHPQTVKKEIMSLLKDAGCIYVDIGVESGSEEIRYKLLKRNMSNQDIINTAKILKEVGIKFCTLNIVGFPGETREQMWETYKLNQALKPDGAIVSIFYPFPKTELTDYCLENNFLGKEDYKKICNGEGGYKESSLLGGVEIKEAKKLQILIPILVKTPRFLRPLIKKISANKFTRIVSIPFLSIPRNTYIRIKESIMMFVKSHYFYLR
ncbi:MAG: hypothetical protein A2909_00090 [Candidatus Tagabacteria bacterium RIFCSPLOWO2_01_FULL_39_11]|uniref:Uncharacterized protein n=1 Tax=Candidatus Tagabacteria bacterium RIFCSPLOWO2_01_FULL_39_11 TaxID=1802295 RepID=A0A1G2LSW7_9BACT|nr:MAG: hypothetical protein A2909_00090 [Candidatus Tagabacteria bacterium RIFCSPLOWO2_01_FULL_39_11]